MKHQSNSPRWNPSTGNVDHGRVYAADMQAALRFKQQFFWNALRALDFNHITGDYAEFGCCGAITFRLAFDQIRSRALRRHMWAFDSFRGLPEMTSVWDSHAKWQPGTMAMDVAAFHQCCAAHGLPQESYSVVEGFYEETLRKTSDAAAPVDIALAYIDCDLHSSTKCVLEFLLPRLKHGMIIALDDYFCWSTDGISGERRALLEAFSGNRQWRLERYRDYGWAGASFVVERSDLLPPNAKIGDSILGN